MSIEVTISGGGWRITRSVPSLKKEMRKMPLSHIISGESID